MHKYRTSRQASRLAYCALLCVMLFFTGCSGHKPGQPFIVPFNSQYITTDKQISVSPALERAGSNSRDFLSITQQNFLFENRNATARVRLILNRKAEFALPEIGEWSTVSRGDCFSNAEGVLCFTAHIDCHLVRTTFIPTGKRSQAMVRVRNNAREPQELCEQWEFHALQSDQQDMVDDFNNISDSYFKFEIPAPPEPQSNGTAQKD